MMQLLLRSHRQQYVNVAEQTSEMPQPISAMPSPHPPSAEELRYLRRERHKPARYKDYVWGIETDHSGTLKELSSPNTRNIERNRTYLFIL